MGQRRHGGNVQHIQAGVAHRFAEEKFGVGLHCRAPGIDVARWDKGCINAKAAQGVVQQVLRAAVQGRAGHNVGARPHQGCNG